MQRRAYEAPPKFNELNGEIAELPYSFTGSVGHSDFEPIARFNLRREYQSRTPHIAAIGDRLAFGGVLTVGVIKHRQHKRRFFFGAIMSVITGNDAAVFSLSFPSGCMSAPMAQTNSNELMAVVISGVIIGQLWYSSSRTSKLGQLTKGSYSLASWQSPDG